MFGLGPQEMIVLAIIGVVFFGKRLPEVGRSLGKALSEFKSGLRGMEDDLYTASEPTPAYRPVADAPPKKIAPSAPKFDDAE